MNKYYYPKNLLDSIDKLFLLSYNKIFDYIAVAVILLACTSIIINIILANKMICKSTTVFYNMLIDVSAVISFAFVFYISIPFVIYVCQLMLFYYNNSNGKTVNTKDRAEDKISKPIVFLILAIVIIISIAINAIVFYRWIL